MKLSLKSGHGFPMQIKRSMKNIGTHRKQPEVVSWNAPVGRKF